MTKCTSPLCHQESSQKTIHKCLDYYVHLKKPILPVIDTDIVSYLKREIINNDSDMSFVAKRTPPAQTIHSAPTNSTPSTAVKIRYVVIPGQALTITDIRQSTL